ncbi:histidine kinase [Agromyces sp. H3Y2-19a]|uniref:sensor histidine kinase n=1 Tax=Agromyces chromiiresistens TaxID=3030835 RepID=UPI0023B9F4F7|nr:histidine kinase [Agromyces chromiiresistens]MDF0514088.1 histidine kinase [Agromyces chromiiresistens]
MTSRHPTSERARDEHEVLRPIAPGARGWRAWTTPFDLALAGGIALWAVLEALLVPSANVIAQLGFALAVSLPLVVRRRFPALVMLAVACALLLHAATSGPDATFNPFPSLLVATFTVAERIAAWWRAALLGLVPIAAMLGAHVLGYFGSPGIETAGTVFLVFFVGATWTAGRVVRHRALTLQRTRDSSDRLAADAVAAERVRIARELHDIVAHALSIVALQAGAAEQFLDKDLDRARRHLTLTRGTAQSALDEMRHLLGVLREDGAVYAPQPGLSGLPELIAETEAAGHECRLHVDEPARDIPDGHALAVHRIVQESLTNVRTHAAGAPVEVRVSRDERAVVVAVVNGAPTVVRPGAPGSGRGLPGMGERVRVYGGSLEAGPSGAGWRVAASLPLGPLPIGSHA